MLEIVRLAPEMLLGNHPFPEKTITPGVWIAGGACRRWFTGEPQDSDVDVFAADDDAAENFVAKNGLGDGRDTYNAVTYGKIQVIKIRYKHVAETLESFDYTLCHFAWDGSDFWATAAGIVSVLRKRLSVHSIQKAFAVDSLRRAFKYAKTGYWPCAGTIRDIAKALSQLNEEEVKQQAEFSPGGTALALRYD